MAELGASNLSTSGEAPSVGNASLVATKLGVWALEIVSEAVGTCLIIVASTFFQFRHEEPPLGNDLSWYKVAGISTVVLIEFAMTGYLATTLVSRFALRGKVRGLYPYACAVLYLLHSTVFFVAAGNPLLRVEDLAVQFPGAILALACTWAGNRLVDRWNRSTGLRRVDP